MMARPKGKPRPMKDIRQAVAMYVAGTRMKDIADTFGVTQPTVSYWVTRHGDLPMVGGKLPARRKGRRTMQKPNERDAGIISAVNLGVPAHVVVKWVGMSRQRVNHILKTWEKRGYKPDQPYKVGSVISHAKSGNPAYKIVSIPRPDTCIAIQITDASGNAFERGEEFELTFFRDGALANIHE